MSLRGAEPSFFAVLFAPFLKEGIRDYIAHHSIITVFTGKRALTSCPPLKQIKETHFLLLQYYVWSFGSSPPPQAVICPQLNSLPPCPFFRCWYSTVPAQFSRLNCNLYSPNPLLSKVGEKRSKSTAHFPLLRQKRKKISRPCQEGKPKDMLVQ